jgi:hypothetical protein
MVASIGHYIDNKPVAGKSGPHRRHHQSGDRRGDGQGRLRLGRGGRCAVQVAKKAQLAWAATPPLRRQRVMFNLKGLIEKRTDDLARHLSLEHGKTFDDAKGEVGRGLEVVEFACGIAHHMKGDFTEQVATDMDTWSIRQPLGVVGRHHAVQLPDHDPVLDGRDGGGDRQRLHPEAVGEGPERADAAGRALPPRRAPRRHLPGDQRRQGRGRCAAQASRRAGDLVRRLDRDRRVRLSHRHADE